MTTNQPIYSTRRIAKNALFLYVRTLVVLCISLYLSRLVLSALGAEDLGIYNVVAGIITMVAFFQAALTKSTGRFITYELGLNCSDEQRRTTFGACLGIHCLLAFVIILVAETIGLWGLHHLVAIPPDRLYAAKFIYQLSVLTFSIHLLCIPFSAAIVAHEKMSVYSVISIVEIILKLMGVLCLPYIAADSLILYGVVIASTALIIFFVNSLYVLRQMPLYRTRPIWSKEVSWNIISFSGWTMLGSATNAITQQGVALLFNNFVSLIANAALGIANQVNAALTQFVNSFTTAFNPQVIKLCAANEYPLLHRLMTLSSKISFVLAYIIALPLITNMEYILTLWLVDVPQYTCEFCQLILVCTVFDATTGVYNTAITASGKIRNYQIAISVSFLLDFCCAFLLLYWHFHPAIVFGSRIMTRGVINMLIGLHFTHRLLQFDTLRYFRQTILPILGVILITIPFNYLFTNLLNDIWLLIVCVISDTVLIVGLSYMIILNTQERALVINLIKNRKKYA